jgi:hypothetical protein
MSRTQAITCVWFCHPQSHSKKGEDKKHEARENENRKGKEVLLQYGGSELGPDSLKGAWSLDFGDPR